MVRPGTRASNNCSRLCPGERWMSSAVRTVPGGLLGSVGGDECCDVRREQAASRSSDRNARVTVAIRQPLEGVRQTNISVGRSARIAHLASGDAFMRIYGPAWPALFALLIPCSTATSQLRVASPDRRNVVMVDTHEGRLYYSVQRDGRPLLTPSLLGFELRGAPSLRDSLRIVDSSRSTFDETWTQPWGAVSRIRDHHNELKVGVEETKAPSRKFTLAVRAFNDGVAFRYEFPQQASLADFEIMDELTEFAMADNSDRRQGDGAVTVGHRPEPQSAPPGRHREHRLDQADEVRRHLVGHAHRHDDLELRAEARGHDREYQALYRFCGGERLWRRAGRRLERRLGRRLDPEPQCVLVYSALRRLRHHRARPLREVEGRAPHRPQRDIRWDPELRAPDRQRVLVVPLPRPGCDQVGVCNGPDQ